MKMLLGPKKRETENGGNKKKINNILFKFAKITDREMGKKKH